MKTDKQPGVMPRRAGRAPTKSISVAALSSSPALRGQVAQIKQTMVRQFGSALSGHGQLLKTALNEAEAVAWQTPYPHLVFPMLAEEKALAVNRWAARQRSVQRTSREIRLAA